MLLPAAKLVNCCSDGSLHVGLPRRGHGPGEGGFLSRISELQGGCHSDTPETIAVSSLPLWIGLSVFELYADGTLQHELCAWLLLLNSASGRCAVLSCAAVLSLTVCHSFWKSLLLELWVVVTTAAMNVPLLACAGQAWGR